MIPFKRGQCLRIPSKPLTNVTYIAADFAKRKSIILTKIILISKAEKITETRMHSSRMPTVRSSSRLLGGLPRCMLGYTPLHLGLAPLPPGLGLETPARPLNLPAGYGPGDPHPVNRMIDTCKNITFANFDCGR